MERYCGRTRESYGAGPLRFNQFCDRENIPEGSRMSASAYLLTAVIVDACGKTTGSAVRNWINGLQLWYI